MVKLTWSTELAKIAQMWSNQCNPGHDINRNTLDGEQVGISTEYFYFIKFL